jgi:glucosyl-3-phosphoglycerate synthase
VLRNKRQTVSACLPAKGCEATVGPIVEVLLPLLDEVVVVAADGPTAAAADAAGARALDESALEPQAGPVRGKGDAMWRALPELSGELVVFLDADTEGFGAHFATGLLAPLLAGEADFVKGFYRRPLGDDPEGGGRVNHLMARPALRVFFPGLADVRQPLAGEVAATRALLERLPFATGYGVEVAMLIDAYRAVGADRLAQVDLGVHHNAHQSLQALSGMAETVLRVIAQRAGIEGVEGVPERPARVAA